MKLGDPGFWIDTLGRAEPRPGLEGDRAADVVIVGAGYTGLWTAYYLLKQDPSLDVVVLERDFAGAGASGRNGGWVSGFFSGPPKLYDRTAGPDGFNRLQRQMFETVDEVGRVIESERIEADWVKGGSLGIATDGAQEQRGRHEVRDLHARGFTEEDLRYLEPDEVRSRLRFANGRGATFSPHVARINPAKLAFGLADVVERLGATIHEGTPVERIEPRAAVTDRGTVRADWVIRATEGYTASLAGLKRCLVPMNSSMIMTEPLDEAMWEEIGWEGRETVGDNANAYFYLQRTEDGRITIGGRGKPYRYGSPTTGIGGITRATVDSLKARLDQLFPVAAEVEVSHGWSGVLGVPRDWGISARADRARGIATAGGYVGEGVATANLSGRTLRDLILGVDSELTRQGWVGRKPARWEPEPIRYAAIHAVYRLYRWADQIEARTGRPSRLARLVDTLSGRH